MSSADAIKALYDRKPDWARGTISRHDARFLYTTAMRLAPATVVEIGTGTGMSTAVLCEALRAARGNDYRVISYDNDQMYPSVDPPRPVGAALPDLLPPHLVDRIELRNPATAITLREHHTPDELSLLFIDANHRHPWPTLDVLATLDLVRPGGEVVLHDINLPLRQPADTDWGAKHLFDSIQVEKTRDEVDNPPNIGRFVVPEDREALREQLKVIAYSREWEVQPPDALVAALL